MEDRRTAPPAQATVMHRQHNLPHRVPGDPEVFVTCRLAGSRPGSPRGPKWLADPAVAAVFAETIQRGAAVHHSYNLLAWEVRADHVHIIIQPKAPLTEIMRWLKSATANRANRLLGRVGQPFWQSEYWDRWIGGRIEGCARRSLTPRPY